MVNFGVVSFVLLLFFVSFDLLSLNLEMDVEIMVYSELFECHLSYNVRKTWLDDHE